MFLVESIRAAGHQCGLSKIKHYKLYYNLHNVVSTLYPLDFSYMKELENSCCVVRSPCPHYYTLDTST